MADSSWIYYDHGGERSEVGPYEYNGKLYAVRRAMDVHSDGLVWLEMVRSVDGGNSWAIVDEANNRQLGPYDYYATSLPFNSCRSCAQSETIWVVFCRALPVIDGVIGHAHGNLVVAAFDCRTETWGDDSVDGPIAHATVDEWRCSTLSDLPGSGISNFYRQHVAIAIRPDRAVMIAYQTTRVWVPSAPLELDVYYIYLSEGATDASPGYVRDRVAWTIYSPYGVPGGAWQGEHVMDLDGTRTYGVVGGVCSGANLFHIFLKSFHYESAWRWWTEYYDYPAWPSSDYVSHLYQQHNALVSKLRLSHVAVTPRLDWTGETIITEDLAAVIGNECSRPVAYLRPADPIPYDSGSSAPSGIAKVTELVIAWHRYPGARTHCDAMGYIWPDDFPGVMAAYNSSEIRVSRALADLYPTFATDTIATGTVLVGAPAGTLPEFTNHGVCLQPYPLALEVSNNVEYLVWMKPDPSQFAPDSGFDENWWQRVLDGRYVFAGKLSKRVNGVWSTEDLSALHLSGADRKYQYIEKFFSNRLTGALYLFCDDALSAPASPGGWVSFTARLAIDQFLADCQNTTGQWPNRYFAE